LDEVFPSLKRKEEPFGHQQHIGSVTCMDWSPFHRNLFLTGGADGVVKLFHILEQTPIMKWEPCAANPQGILRILFLFS
jgi:WD40 repeat protein